MERTINERINTLARNFFGENNSKFAEIIGTSEANIRNYRKGTSPSIDILEKICNKLEISCEWLLLGRGNIFTNSNPKLLNMDIKHDPFSGEAQGNMFPRVIRVPEGSMEGIPLITLDAAAGFGSGEFQVMEYECERYVVPLFKGAEFLIPIRGSSMYPKYSSGDIVACKNIPLNDIFFQWNKVYVLDTDQGPIIKRVKKGSDDNHILIVSENEKYDPFELHKSQLNGVAIVIGVIRLE